jgi:hypothetical protein
MGVVLTVAQWRSHPEGSINSTKDMASGQRQTLLVTAANISAWRLVIYGYKACRDEAQIRIRCCY